MAAFGQFILKSGMNQVGVIDGSQSWIQIIWRMLSNKLVLVGLALFGANAILWLIVLSREKLSFAYPMVAFAYVVTVLLSRYALREDVPLLRWAGLAVIIVGILMIAKSST